MRALFGVARAKQPAVIFIDEVDSILSQRREGEQAGATTHPARPARPARPFAPWPPGRRSALRATVSHLASRSCAQEGTVRVKNEILVQMDGVSNADANERLLLVGATNRPQELDEAARRRLQKRLLIPLPDAEARKEMLVRGLNPNPNPDPNPNPKPDPNPNQVRGLNPNPSPDPSPKPNPNPNQVRGLNPNPNPDPNPNPNPNPNQVRGLKGVSHSLSEADVDGLTAATDGYSGSDMASVGREAAMGPCRDEGFMAAMAASGGVGLDASSVRPVSRKDYDDALCQVRASVSQADLKAFDDWNKQYGSFANHASLASGK